MRRKDCFNDEGARCKVLKVDECPFECSAMRTDPVEYMKMLHDLMKTNHANEQSLAGLRKEVKDLMKRYKLKPGTHEDLYYGLAQAYAEDKHRGGGGGSSEQDANSATSMKQKMKDNRPLECKQTVAQKTEVRDALNQWEEENGKLEKLSRSPLTRNKLDSYTGEPIE